MWLAPWIVAWLKAFVFTQAIEMPIYRFGLRVSWARAFGASALTHPIVWLFVLWWAPEGWSWPVRVVLAEAFAVVVEAAYLARVAPWRRAAGGALIANGASFLLGTLARAWFDV